jgi:emericellamide synthase (highly reducing iterative type I polyketide synthase)
MELTWTQPKAVPPLPAQAQLKPDVTYAVVGGLGGLGRAFIAWMAEHGARHVLSISRSGAVDHQSQVFIAEMNAKGVRLVAKKCDVTLQDEVASLMQEAERDGLPQIRGVLQSAMVLKVRRRGVFSFLASPVFPSLHQLRFGF